jgi:hypothetical protein
MKTDLPADAVSTDRSPSETTDLPLTDRRKVDILLLPRLLLQL